MQASYLYKYTGDTSESYSETYVQDAQDALPADRDYFEDGERAGIVKRIIYLRSWRRVAAPVGEWTENLGGQTRASPRAAAEGRREP